MTYPFLWGCNCVVYRAPVLSVVPDPRICPGVAARSSRSVGAVATVHRRARYDRLRHDLSRQRLVKTAIPSYNILYVFFFG